MHGQHLPRERTEEPFHAIADDGIADLLGDGDPDPHTRIIVAARPRQQHEAGHRSASARIRPAKILAGTYGRHRNSPLPPPAPTHWTSAAYGKVEQGPGDTDGGRS